MKTIGVIGGMGPQATIDFEKKVHEFSKILIPQHINRGYPPMVTYYYRNDPRAITDSTIITEILVPNDGLLEIAKKLGIYADFLVIPSNTPHFFRKEIEKTSGLPLLSMVDVTLEKIISQKPTSVGVIAIGDTINHRLYQDQLEKSGITPVIISDEIIKKLDKSVWAVMEGADPESVSSPAYEAIEYLENKEVDLIILGCSEIALMLGEDSSKNNLINPVQLLAERAVEHSIK